MEINTGGSSLMTIDINTLSVLFPLLLLLLGLGFAVVIDSYLSRKHRQIMLVIIVLCLSLIVQNVWENALFVSQSDLKVKNALSAYGYTVRPVILVLFQYLTLPDRKKWFSWALAGINGALYCSSPYTKLCFEIRERDYASLRGPLWFTCTIISAILLAHCGKMTVTFAVRHYERCGLALLQDRTGC